MSAPAVLQFPASRASVLAMEQEICKLPQTEPVLRHYFADGLYAREATIPANTIFTGATHKTTHLCVLSKGTIAVMTDDGIKMISAPYTIVSQAGMKRVGLTMTEVVWTNFHATTETDLDKLVEELTTSTADELVGGKNNKQMEMNKWLSLAQQHQS